MLNPANTSLDVEEDLSLRPNAIYSNDCKEALRRFQENCVDLVYLNPPFFSNKHYEVIWGDGYEIRAFADRWKGGIHNYIGWMEERLRECHKVLKESGSIFLHCDWRASSRLRIVLDDIFGMNNFRNEIIWCYTGASSKGQQQLPRKHETIWWYSKSNAGWTFNEDEARVPYSQSTLERIGAGVRGGKSAQSVFHGIRTGRTANEGGKIMEDWWMIPALGSTAKERIGYPTQKPEALLDRIIRIASKPTDIVLDPFCGGGTTIAVAHRLGRRWIGIDVSPTACKIMQKRMKSFAINFDLIGMPKTVEQLKKQLPFEFQNWVMDRLYARVNPTKTGDMGIDGYYLDGTPIQVKQSEDVGRNVIDNFETAIQRKARKKGIIVAFSFGKGAYEEVARAKEQQGLEITLKKVQDILDET